MKLYLISIATVAVALQVQAATPRIITVPQDYPTIAAAIAAANSGDTINVNPGTYNKGSQSWSFGDKLIALRSVAGPTVTKLDIHGGSALGIKGKSEISGFTISNSQPHYGESIHVTGDGTLIRGNIFENNHGSTGGLGAAIVGNPASPIIDGNLFRNNTTDLVQEAGGVIAFYNGGAINMQSSPIIENNVFVDNQAPAIQFFQPSGNQPVIINNTFVNNTFAISYNSFSFAIVRDNIFSNNGQGFYFGRGNGTAHPRWDHNLLFNSGFTYNWMSPNVTSDPLFVSSADFHLQAGSPAIGAGTLTGAPKFDFDGIPRSLTTNDLGAFVFVPEPSTLVLAGGLFATSLLTFRRRFGR